QGDMTPPTEFHYFLGWDTDKDVEEPKYEEKEAYTPTENTTLFAIWGLPLVKKVEGYMALTTTELKAKMTKNGFEYKENPHMDNAGEYTKPLGTGFESCSINYEGTKIKTIRYAYKNLSENRDEYIEEFEDWKAQTYALEYTDNFEGRIDAPNEVNYTDPTVYETEFESKKNDLTYTSISISGTLYSVLVSCSIVKNWEMVSVFFSEKPNNK
ncbi:MAG: hypothetical protein ACRCZZ_07275, partial [Phocaeicola sp.]